MKLWTNYLDAKVCADSANRPHLMLPRRASAWSPLEKDQPPLDGTFYCPRTALILGQDLQWSTVYRSDQVYLPLFAYTIEERRDAYIVQAGFEMGAAALAQLPHVCKQTVDEMYLVIAEPCIEVPGVGPVLYLGVAFRVADP